MLPGISSRFRPLGPLETAKCAAHLNLSRLSSFVTRGDFDELNSEFCVSKQFGRLTAEFRIRRGEESGENLDEFKRMQSVRIIE